MSASTSKLGDYGTILNMAPRMSRSIAPFENASQGPFTKTLHAIMWVLVPRAATTTATIRQLGARFPISFPRARDGEPAHAKFTLVHPWGLGPQTFRSAI